MKDGIKSVNKNSNMMSRALAIADLCPSEGTGSGSSFSNPILENGQNNGSIPLRYADL